MSIDIKIGKETIEVVAIEVRPGEGVIVRVKGDPSEAGLKDLEAELNIALRGSAHAVYRRCCDSVPRAAHVEGCQSAAATTEAKT